MLTEEEKEFLYYWDRQGISTLFYYRANFTKEAEKFYDRIKSLIIRKKQVLIYVETILPFFQHYELILDNYGVVVLFTGLLNLINEIIEEIKDEVDYEKMMENEKWEKLFEERGGPRGFTKLRKDGELITDEIALLKKGSFTEETRFKIQAVNLYLLEDKKKSEPLLKFIGKNRYDKIIKEELKKQDEFLNRDIEERKKYEEKYNELYPQLEENIEEKQYPQLEENITQRILEDSENIEEKREEKRDPQQEENYDERIKRIVKYWGYDNYKEIYTQEFDDEYVKFYSHISNVVKKQKSDFILVENVLSHFVHNSNILFNYGAVVLFSGMIKFISDIIKDIPNLNIQVKTNFRKDTNEMIKLVGKFDQGVKETIEFVSIYILEDEKKKKEILSEFSDRKIKNYEKAIKFEIIKQEKYLKQQPIQEVKEIKLNLEKNINENIVEKMNDEKQQAMNEKMAKLRAMRKIRIKSEEEKKMEYEKKQAIKQKMEARLEKKKQKAEKEEKEYERMSKNLDRFQPLLKNFLNEKKEEKKQIEIPLTPVITTSIEEEKKEDMKEKMAKLRAMRKTRPKTSEGKEYKIPIAPLSAFKKLKPQIQEFRNEQNVERYENQLYRRDEKQELKREPERSYNKVRIRGDNLLEKSSKLYINILEKQRKELYDYLKKIII